MPFSSKLPGKSTNARRRRGEDTEHQLHLLVDTRGPSSLTKATGQRLHRHGPLRWGTTDAEIKTTAAANPELSKILSFRQLEMKGVCLVGNPDRFSRGKPASTESRYSAYTLILIKSKRLWIFFFSFSFLSFFTPGVCQDDIFCAALETFTDTHLLHTGPRLKKKKIFSFFFFLSCLSQRSRRWDNYPAT